MNNCDRCDSEKMVDFCTGCHSELCSSCMSVGCCNVQPAGSGNERQRRRFEAFENGDWEEEYWSEHAGLSHWEEFEVDNLSKKTKGILARMGIESGTSCRWHDPEELEEAGISRRDMSEIVRYFHGRWKKWPRPEPKVEIPPTEFQKLTKGFDSTFEKNAEKTVFGRFVLGTMTGQLVQLDEAPRARKFACIFESEDGRATQEISLDDLKEFPIFWRMLFATEETRALLVQPNIPQDVS